ncbi:MAG: family 78 glycoside hydrolase catalytic domain [Clostridia bacterium]|nr:family 78 glycoside hydrolase catalytic domain [Clostridia bacterium]
MEQNKFFGNAKWVGAAERTRETFSVLRGEFNIDSTDSAKKVTVNVLGLGFFKCFINGICINPDTFLPLSSDFEPTCDPVDEVISGHRIYVPSFDITPLVTEGRNTIAIHFGGGWYTHRARVFGLPKAIYSVIAEGADGKLLRFGSDEDCRIGGGFVSGYDFTSRENHDYTAFSDCFGKDFDDSAWKNAVLTEELNTDYLSTDCPIDKLIRCLPLKVVGSFDGKTVYDCGENTTGYPVLRLNAAQGETVTVRFSEELLPDGNLDPKQIQNQSYSIVSDGKERVVQPEFTWYCFRYLEVTGDAVPECVKEIYADIGRASSFDCDNETLNWTYNTFIHTMLCNMHTGHPSDCPHLERRGYTGDGQLTCHAALSVLDAKSFYEKWLADIGDCQDKLSGHIQYTAPYIRSGGGHGGWGCAIVEVPYQLYKHYGDKEILAKYYGNMRRYIDYLEAHSEFGLVTSDKKGEWCLGDWCGPNILYPERDITSHNQQVIIPAPFVNTYFMVKSLITMRKIAAIIGKDGDIAEYDEKINTRKNAIRAAYFNTFDGNFVMNVQGSNSFAVDLGLGDKKTYPNMVRYYEKLGYFDTGIFATDVVIRTMFERGDAELAVDILMGNGDQGYEHWRRNGATTFHEYWDSNRSRSHCHPMFGAPIAYFFEYLLGIRQTEESCGYSELIIAPQAVSRFGRMQGSMETPLGAVAVSYAKENEGVRFRVSIPAGCKAIFRLGELDRPLSEGENEIFIDKL